MNWDEFKQLINTPLSEWSKKHKMYLAAWILAFIVLPIVVATMLRALYAPPPFNYEPLLLNFSMNITGALT